MNATTETGLPLRILIYALGGEGGGVLMNWIVEAGRAAGRKVQATSVPGVAQRTGSTSYYVEIAAPGTDPVLGLMPMPGRVDVVLASELVEAARAMEAGYVSPKLTTLIASTNRVYATSEKIDMADGRYDSDRIVEAAQAMAKQAHLADLSDLATRNGTFISATLYGALIGSGVLPWDRETSLKVLGEGRGAEASRRGVEAAEAAVTEGDAPADPADGEETAPDVPDSLRDLPEAVQKVATLGHERLIDYQNRAYADLYADRVKRIAEAADGATDVQTVNAIEEAARRLALWMAYEDVARVADLKTRPDRFARIRAESEMKPGQILKVVEYMKPRAEEMADILPVSIGRRIMKRVEAGKGFPFLGRGVNITSNGVFGYWMLRTVAQMRRIRPRSLRYHREQETIETWLDALTTILPRSPALAEALATLPRLRKGYSDTLERGCRAYDRIFAEVVTPALAGKDDDAAAKRLRGAISAAQADDTHGKLDAFLAGEEAPAPIPVLTMPKEGADARQ